jgi:hypothetical protein
MLPVIIPAALDIVLLVVVIYVLVVDVDVHVAVPPAATITPAAASPCGPDRNASAKRKGSITGRIVH